MAKQPEITLESLGLNADALAERLVDRLAETVLTSVSYDEDGDEFRGKNALSRKLEALVQQRIDQSVNEIAEKHLLPRVAEMVENVTFQQTNEWGEAKKPPLTFREYLVTQAERWMSEPVDYEGKPKGRDSFGWHASNTRVAHMVHQHLDHHIHTAMAAALKDANSKIAGGIEAAVKMQLQEVLGKLKVDVKTK